MEYTFLKYIEEYCRLIHFSITTLDLANWHFKSFGWVRGIKTRNKKTQFQKLINLGVFSNLNNFKWVTVGIQKDRIDFNRNMLSFCFLQEMKNNRYFNMINHQEKVWLSDSNDHSCFPHHGLCIVYRSLTRCLNLVYPLWGQKSQGFFFFFAS